MTMNRDQSFCCAKAVFLSELQQSPHPKTTPKTFMRKSTGRLSMAAVIVKVLQGVEFPALTFFIA